MPNAYVLVTALPPTTGHADLIDFARSFMFRKDLADGAFAASKRSRVEVIVSTQPSEPFAEERWEALSEHFTRLIGNVYVHWFHDEIEQNPLAPGFWDMWRGIMRDHGFVKGDYIFASEPYGARLAEECGGKFIPFDLDRQINSVKATNVRHSPRVEWKNMIPEFQQYVTTRVTVFGAESCGKTTMTKVLGNAYAAQTLPEWARPYLETVGPRITTDKMTDIFYGQSAIQIAAKHTPKSPVVIQDTDLYSTIGYWEMWDKNSVPQAIYGSAKAMRSDLYLIMSSEIPFEEDELRYGGKVRESDDQYWIDLCERFNLPYVYITGESQIRRTEQCVEAVNEAIRKKVEPLSSYERKFNG